MICNISEAALHLGYRSRSTLQRLVRGGLLNAYLVESTGRQVLLETEPIGRPTLRDAVRGLTQLRVDSPLFRAHGMNPGSLADLSDAELDAAMERDYSDEALVPAVAELDAWIEGHGSLEWAVFAERANGMLDLERWGPPPWSGNRWSTLAMVIDMAHEAGDS